MELYLAYLPCVNGTTKSCCCGTTLQWLTISCVLFKGSGFSNRSNHTGRDKYGPPVRTEYRLVVENLSSRCSWQDLKVYLESNLLLVHVYTSISPIIFLCYQDFMRQAGEVTYADAHKERTNEGVIEFRSYSDMKRALDKLDGTDINGRKIRLVEDRPRRGRSYSGSRSRYELFCGTSSLFFKKNQPFLTLDTSIDLAVVVVPAAGAVEVAGALEVAPGPAPGQWSAGS